MHSTTTEKARLDPEIHDSGFFVLRTPLLPFDDFLNWGANLSAPGVLDDYEQLVASLAKDREILRTRLNEIVSRPDVLEALFIASPDLCQSLETWRRSPDSSRGQRIERALVRYFERLTGRATPFGLCAGISVGEIGDKTELMLVDRMHYKRHTRLDMKYLEKLMALQAVSPSFRNAHVYLPNSSLYQVADRFHYVEEERVNNSRIHRLVAIDSSPLLAAALERSSEGASLADLIQTLTGLDGASALEAKEFVEELIDNQVLVPDFGPALTGPEALLDAIEQLRKYPESEHLISQLNEIGEHLESIDREGLGVSVQRYYAIGSELDQLTAPHKVGRYLKVDLVKPAVKMTLGRGLVNQIIRGVKVLQRLAPPPDTELQEFRSKFIERYGTRELPLALVLDEEVGIGFNFDKFNAPQWRLQIQGNGALGNPQTDNSPADALLLKKVFEAQAKGEAEISLNAEDLKLLDTNQTAPLPASFTVKAVLIRHNQAENDYWVEIKNVVGPSGGNYLARFCQAEGDLSRLVEGHLRAEEKPYSDVVFAEVVHLPEEGIANVLCRPLFRDFEIPYLGRSGAPSERQIALTDLLISVQDDRIVLRSKRLGREVVPRLTTAHNFSPNRNLAVYRFLCLLQRQGTARLTEWDWGTAKDLPFLPRVTAGRLILARARWNVSSDELPVLRDGSATDCYLAVQQWRVKRKLPRCVAFATETSSELPLDFDNVLSVETFLELLKKHGEARLIERFLSESTELFAGSPQGNFAGDILVPIVNTAKQPSSPVARPTVSIKDRSFPPGSEWLFLKMYCGAATIDRSLCSLYPFVEQVLSLGAADRWFFIRYNDPHPHVRLRFHGDPATLRTGVLPQLQDFGATLIDAGLVWRVQIDTYDREIERYGGLHGTALSEEIFFADSMFALAILDNYSGANAGASARWFLTLRSLDQMLSDFGLTTRSKHEFVRRFRVPPLPTYLAGDFKRHLSEKYRRERKAIESVMIAPIEDQSPYSPGLLALQRRTDRLIELAERFRTLEQEGKLTRPLRDILRSFTHMHINRMLKSDFRELEFVAYDFLRRYYEWLATTETVKS